MNLGFIGAGKVGVSLGKYFRIKGLEVVGFWSKSGSSRKEAAQFTGAKAFENLEELISACEVIFITTPDDKISEVWDEIIKYDIRDKYICNTSGSVASKIFKGSKAMGVYAYSVHPSFPFHDKYETYKQLDSAVFSIQGDAEKIDEVKALISSAGNRVYEIDKDSKALYHLSNVMASNLVISLIDASCECMEGCGLSKGEALELLTPLIKSNINNLCQNGFTAAITGPVERGDAGTIKKHLEVMPNEYIKLYEVLTKNLIKIAEDKHPQRNYENIMDLFME